MFDILGWDAANVAIVILSYFVGSWAMYFWSGPASAQRRVLRFNDLHIRSIDCQPLLTTVRIAEYLSIFYNDCIVLITD